MTKDLTEPLGGRHVLFVEDVIDTGLTSRFILGTLRHHEPATLGVCVLLNRPSRRIIDIELEYVGFAVVPWFPPCARLGDKGEVPDAYLVGYGLDYRERYRNLPYLVRFEPTQQNELRK